MKLDRDKLIRAREMLGYGVEKTAEEAGVSKNSVLRAEHEEDIRPVTARKIAAALEVEVRDLLPLGQASLLHEPPEEQKAALKGRHDWIAEATSLKEEAEATLDSPDLSPDVCFLIQTEAGDLWEKLSEERQQARRPPYSFKELNDLANAERISFDLYGKAIEVFLNRFGENKEAQEVEQRREDIRKATRRIERAG